MKCLVGSSGEKLAVIDDARYNTVDDEFQVCGGRFVFIDS